MFVIGVSFVGYWQSLEPSAFLNWFAANADRIGGLMLPLGAAATLARSVPRRSSGLRLTAHDGDLQRRRNSRYPSSRSTCGACAPKRCVRFGRAAARASDWRTRSLGAVALSPRAARHRRVLDAAGRNPGEVSQCLRMSILTINLLLSTLVFWIAARIYVLPRLDELRPWTVLPPILLLHSFRHLGLMFLAPGAHLPWHSSGVCLSGSLR
jgi:hypothetical protein